MNNPKRMPPQPATDFLVPTSSVFTGAGTVLNLAGNFFDYNVSDSSAEADFIALQSDWMMVGQDFRAAMDSDALMVALLQHWEEHGKIEH